jgi:hypothetical protein
MFAKAYMGRKRILPMLSLHGQGLWTLARLGLWTPAGLTEQPLLRRATFNATLPRQLTYPESVRSLTQR